MRVNVRHLNIRTEEIQEVKMEAQLQALGARRLIDEANVRVIRSPECSPPYQVQVHLVTPGPDLFAESRDHTLRAAFSKAVQQIDTQITHRGSKRRQRLRGSQQVRRAD